MPAADVLPRLRTRLAILYAAAAIVLGAVLLAFVAVPFWTGGSTRHVGAGGAATSTSNAGTLVPAAVTGLIVIAIVAGPLGWLLAGRAVRPLEQLAAAARTAAPDRLPGHGERGHGAFGRGAFGRGEPGRYREFADLSATLAGLYARLDAAYFAQRRFVADASHELRTPLAVQRTLIQVALADPDADTATLREVCEELLRVNGQQERLVAALLALAQGEQRARSHDPVDLAALAGAALVDRSAAAAGRGLRVATDLQPAVVPGADATLLASLLGNLVDNAIRYNVDGGRVRVATRRQADGVVLSIENTGPVVPAEAVERIQQPFQRLAAARSGDPGGSGLGLAIVRAIADSHGACLRVRPGPAGGLHVEVAFPAG